METSYKTKVASKMILRKRNTMFYDMTANSGYKSQI